MSANVLVIGRGGREHCLAWKLSQSPYVRRVYVAPGNGAFAGKENADKVESVSTVKVDDYSAVGAFCSEMNVDLVVIGPEAPLAEGIVDYLSYHNVACFGPTSAAARIETSKAFAKDFMVRHGIPTARYQTFTDSKLASKHVHTVHYPALVVKASGLASGKGVIVANSADEAEQAVYDIMTVMIESFRFDYGYENEYIWPQEFAVENQLL